MSSKIPIILAKTLVFIASDYLINKAEKYEITQEDLYRIGTFFTGIVIEIYFLDNKNIFGIIKDEQVNKHFENYVFSMLFQTFGDCLLIDKYKIIIEDLVNITITYALTAPFQK